MDTKKVNQSARARQKTNKLMTQDPPNDPQDKPPATPPPTAPDQNQTAETPPLITPEILPGQVILPIPGEKTENAPEETTDQTPKSASEHGIIYHAEIDPLFQDKALENFRASLHGNGVDPKDAEVKSFEGEILEFIAVTVLRLKTKTAHRRQAGKISGPQVLDSEAAVKQAVEKEFSKITHSQDLIKRIKDVIIQRPDKGFGLKDRFIKLPFLHRDFVVYEPCKTCHSKGKMPCNRCAGRGRENCPRCRASGTEVCPTCGGRQYISGPNGQKQHGIRCNGQGRMPCSVCNQRRQVPCTACKGAAIITCKQCNGHAWNSVVYMVEIDAFANFEYEKEKLPDKIVAQIEIMDEKQREQHIQFTPVIMGREHERDNIVIPYQIRVPHANVVFKIKNLEVPAFMFGLQAMLLGTPSYLEKIMAPGIKSLQKAGKGQGDIAEELKKAGRYKTLRHIILAASRQGHGRALLTVLKNNPVGLSEDSAQKLILLADRALRLITKKPRIYGTISGTLGAGGLYAAYFYALRAPLLTAVKMPVINPLFDGLIFIIGAALAVMSVKYFAAHAMHKALDALTRGEKKKQRLAKAARQGNWAVGGAVLAFMTAAISTLFTTAPSPDWLLKIAHILM